MPGRFDRDVLGERVLISESDWAGSWPCLPANNTSLPILSLIISFLIFLLNISKETVSSTDITTIRGGTQNGEGGCM